MRAGLGTVNCGDQNSGPSYSMCICQGSSLELGQEGLWWHQGNPRTKACQEILGLGTSLGLTSWASSELLWAMVSSPWDPGKFNAYRWEITMSSK